ncbi:MAG: phytanoyl-CoA dioxygenase family protein [Planctomycetota bacterium]|nr:phytanoyl-CoA dioxygenase family protein [Planctomycetota bacterium]
MKNYHNDPGALNIPWVFSPFFDKTIESMSLTAEEQAFARKFRKDGYAIIDTPLADTATTDRAIADLEGRYDTPATGHTELTCRLDAWRWSEAVTQIACAPQVSDLLGKLYGRRAFPFQTLSFEYGSRQYPHSDTIHFHSIPHHFMVGVWVALEDIDPDSGPLRVYPGSHLLPVLDMFDLKLEAGWEDYNKYEAAIAAIVEAQGIEPREITLKRGQAVIWAANLVHGGASIHNEKLTRYSQVTHYYFDDCLYYQAAPSNPFVGRLTLKKVEEIGTDRIAPNLYRGRPIEEWVDTSEVISKPHPSS